MRIVLLTGIVLAALLPGAFAQAPDLTELDIVEQAIPDGPVAMVEGAPLSREDYLFLYRGQRQMAEAQRRGKALSNDERVKLALRCMGELLQREILFQEAQRRKLSVSEADVEKAYTHKIEGLRKRMEKAGKPMNEEEFLKNISQTKAEALSEIRVSLLVNKAFDQIAAEKGMEIPEADIKQFYGNHPELFQQPSGLHLKQIFIHPKAEGKEISPEQWAAAEKRANKILARIRAGESFEGVAKDASDAPDAKQGGDMGMMPNQALPPFFTEAAAKLKPEEMSGLIKSEHGYHLIKLIEKQEGQEVSLEKAKKRILEVLKEVKADDNVNQFCQPILNDESRVQVFLNLETALAAMLEKLEGGAAS